MQGILAEFLPGMRDCAAGESPVILRKVIERIYWGKSGIKQYVLQVRMSTLLTKKGFTIPYGEERMRRVVFPYLNSYEK